MTELFTFNGESRIKIYPPERVAYIRRPATWLEPTPLAYNFAPLRHEILVNAAQGRRTAFRIQAQKDVGQWCNPWGTDWNAENFLLGHDAFVGELSIYLAERDLIRHIAWIECGYGSWDEGADADTIKQKNVIRMLDDWIVFFPDTLLLFPGKTCPVGPLYALARRGDAKFFLNNYGGDDSYFDDIPDYVLSRIHAGEARAPKKMLDEGGHFERIPQQVKATGCQWFANGNFPATLTDEQMDCLLEIGIE